MSKQSGATPASVPARIFPPASSTRPDTRVLAAVGPVILPNAQPENRVTPRVMTESVPKYRADFR